MNAPHLVRIALLGCTLIGCSSSDPNAQPEVLDQQNAGIIPVATYSDGTKGYQYTINPTFAEATAATVCTITGFGNCKQISCPLSRSMLQQGDFGTLTIADGAHTATLPVAVNNYMNILDMSAFFNGGETVSYSAPGTTLYPGFSGSITAPSPLLVTGPTDATLMISQSAPLTLTWTGTSAGVVVLQLQRTDSNAGADISVECQFPTSTNTGTIPASTLAQISADSYTADIFTRTREELNPGSWAILLEARYHAGTTGGGYKRPAIVGP